MKIASIALLATLLTAALIVWGLSPTGARAQECCPPRAGGGSPVGGLAGHQSYPMSRSTGLSGGQSAHQHGAAGGGNPMSLGSVYSTPQPPKAATDVIKWPTFLQRPAFASRREQIEAPYRRSPPGLSTPTASDYRNMEKTVEEMKGTLYWFATKGIDKHDHEQAKDFLNKLGLEVRECFEIVSRTTSANAQTVVAAKPRPTVSLAKLDQSDQAAIAHQQVCPVTGAKLGNMGDPSKVLVGDRPLYLCCADCVAKVKESPDEYATRQKVIPERNRCMFNRHTVNLGFGWIAAALVWAMTSTSAVAQCGGHGGMGGHDHGAAGAGSHSMHSEQPRHHSFNGGVPPLVQHTPHGGLFLEAETHRLEVVYLPQETRVYLFGKSMEPLSTHTLRGDMSLYIQGESSPRRTPLQYAPPRSPKDQDYLVAAADMGRLPNETPVNFRFDNLPDRRHPRAEFTPIFAQSHIRPFVAQASFVQADREGFVGQQVCPVTGARLGSMGEPDQGAGRRSPVVPVLCWLHREGEGNPVYGLSISRRPIRTQQLPPAPAPVRSPLRCRSGG